MQFSILFVVTHRKQQMRLWFFAQLHEILGSRPEFGAAKVATSYSSSSLPTDVEVEDNHTTLDYTDNMHD